MLLMEPQPTPYDLRWRMFGIDIRVHPMFWLISALLGWTWYEVGANGRQGLAFVALWVACVFVSILVHELGHVVAGIVFGSWGYVVLYGFGGLAVGSNDLRKRWQRIIVSLAGPGAQFLVLLLPLWLMRDVFGVFGDRIEYRIRWLERDPLVIACEMFWFVNLFWPLLNLLPIWPLDGGMVTRELCEGTWREKGRRYSLIISMVVAIVLVVQILTSQRGNPGIIPWLSEWLRVGPLTALFFGLFAFQSYQLLQEESSRRRNWNDDRLPWDR